MVTENWHDTRLQMLKKRVKRCVCKYCGHNLYLRKIIFNEFEDVRIEIFCEHCERIEFGVEPEIYLSAKYFVEETEMNLFTDMDENEQTKQMTIAKVCEIMAWENQNLGFLNSDGFKVPVNVNTNLLGECIILDDNDLNETEEIDLDKLKTTRFY